MKPSVLLTLYWRRLQAQPLRELLAGLGVAVGVALVFSVLVANQSIAGSSDQIVRALAGSAQLEVQSRAPNGFPAAQLEQLPGVRQTAAGLDAPVAIRSATRTVSTQLAGVSPATAFINGLAAQVPITAGGVLLPSALASQLQVRRGDTVTLFARGRHIHAEVQAVLGDETIGPLADSTLAFAQLSYAQEVLGMTGRETSVLVQAQPGRELLARRSLERAMPNTDVMRATADEGLLARAVAPQGQATDFFALIGLLVGGLLVAMVMLLTTPERRRVMRDLRLQEFGVRELLAILLSQAALLGAVASTVGVLVGYLLATGAWRANPAYLEGAFPLGTQTVVSPLLVLAIWVGGLLASCIAVCPALIGLHGYGLRPAGIRAPVGTRPRLLMLALTVVLVGLSAVLPGLPAAGVLVVALLLVLPAWWSLTLALVGRVRRPRLLSVASRSVRAAPIRSIALAATAAIGVFGAMVGQGAHRDLLRGLEHGYAQYVASADMWVTNTGDDLATSSLPVAHLERAIPGVRKVRPYYGGWLDMAGRRVWLIARTPPAPAGQILHGTNHGLVLSDQFARSIHATIGDMVSIPTPSGELRLRLAGTITNLGWSSGVMVLPASVYLRYWPDATPTALEIDGSLGAARAINRLLPPGVVIQSSAARAATADALPRQGLERLSQIALLLAIAAAAATATAMAAAVWQRRQLLASLRLQEFSPRQILAILSWEALMQLGAGAVVGCAAGVYGHVLADRYLQLSTGYPVLASPDVPQLAVVLLLVAAAAAAVLAAPGYIASRTPPALALDGS